MMDANDLLEHYFLSNQVDVYSFGVLLCEMCIREQPDPEDRERQIERIIDCRHRGLVRQCVQREPWARPNMDTIIEELERPGERTSGI